MCFMNQHHETHKKKQNLNNRKFPLSSLIWLPFYIRFLFIILSFFFLIFSFFFSHFLLVFLFFSFPLFSQGGLFLFGSFRFPRVWAPLRWFPPANNVSLTGCTHVKWRMLGTNEDRFNPTAQGFLSRYNVTKCSKIRNVFLIT